MNGTELSARSSAGADGASSTATADADYYRRLLDRLVSMLSHDLRTPLSAISGWVFLLESDKLDAAGRKRAVDKIRANVDDEVRLIDDMQALVRVKAGTLTAEIAPVAVDDVLGAAIEKTQRAAAAKSFTVDEVKAADRPALIVSADAGRLQRAFELIIERAIGDAHGASPKLSIEALETGSSVDIAFRDNGRGIAADALRWVLDPFGSPPDAESGSRHNPDRSLLIAAALIDANGGRLSVESEGEGNGTAITVTLPRAS